MRECDSVTSAQLSFFAPDCGRTNKIIIICILYGIRLFLAIKPNEAEEEKINKIN